MIKANFKSYATYLIDSIYQWDINQKLSITGLNLSTSPEVHFSNANCDRAIVKQSSTVNHVVTVDIPNSLLQEPLTIFAHVGIYENDTFKIVEVVEIPVIPRKRPFDYQIEDSDEEIYSFKKLQNAISNMLTHEDGSVINARIDNIVANSNSTANNSELVDIRVDAEGKTHSSAGAAVRSQFNKLKHEETTLAELSGIKWLVGYISSSGNHIENVGRKCTDFIPCGSGVDVTFIGETAHTGISGLTFYDIDKNVISTNVNIGENGLEYTVTSPNDTRFVRLSTGDSIGYKLAFSEPAVFSAINANTKMIVENTENLHGEMIYNTVVNGRHFDSFILNQSGITNNADGSLTIAPGGHYFMGVHYAIFTGSTYFGIKYDRDERISISFSDDGAKTIDETIIPYLKTINVNGYEVGKIDKDNEYNTHPYIIIRIDNRNSVESLTVSEIKIVDGGEAIKTNMFFVAPNGNDKNDGTITAPLASVNRALALGAEHIYMRGGYYNQLIDLSKAVRKHINISNYDKSERVVFRPLNYIISESETKVSGYNNVYSVVTTQNFADYNIWIFQDGINDETTLISDDERHPLQRGYEYRCSDTKIARTTATALSDALDEIEALNGFKWFYHSTTSTLYFSRPATITADKPLCGSFGSSLFRNATRDITLIVSGIESKYMAFDISNTTNSIITDCKCTNVRNAGAFIYNEALGCKFVNCEAARCFTGTNGDGFNAHSEKVGDPKSKHTTAIFVDCWSHDNNDDGYSDHERSEITIIGGLFEYNGKAGITPSYGSHCTCHNVYSRKNYAGFYYCGDVAEDEGGKYGQMICYNCVAENNTRGGLKDGFRVDGDGNSMILVNCKAIGNERGFVIGNTLSKAKLIDCGSLNNTTVKTGDFEISNTTIVT